MTSGCIRAVIFLLLVTYLPLLLSTLTSEFRGRDPVIHQTFIAGSPRYTKDVHILMRVCPPNEVLTLRKSKLSQYNLIPRLILV